MQSFTTTVAVLKLCAVSREMGWATSLEQGELIEPSSEKHLAAEPPPQHASRAGFTWNEIENKKIYALYGSKKKNVLNDHDQDNGFVVREITNLGSYSSSRQGTCRAAPWETVFYKQTDRDPCRKRWSKTAGLCTCEKWKRRKKKQLRR